MILRIPGVTDGGIRTYQLTESVDIFPTLADFALGKTLPTCNASSSHRWTCTEGTSLRPLVDQPEVPLKQAAWAWETEEAGVVFLTAPPVQRLLRTLALSGRYHDADASTEALCCCSALSMATHCATLALAVMSATSSGLRPARSRHSARHVPS